MKKISKADKVLSQNEKELVELKGKSKCHAVKRKKATKDSPSTDEPSVKQIKLTDIFKAQSQTVKTVLQKNNGTEPNHKKTAKLPETKVPPQSEIHAKIGSSVIDKIKGDGNCFFRAISKEVFGEEERHQEMRKTIVDYMQKNRQHFDMYIDGDPSAHIEDMKEKCTWATQAESFACASLLGREIFVLTPHTDTYKWCLFSPKDGLNCLTTKCKCHITICNTNGDHYDRVIDSAGKCNCGSKRPTLNG